MPFPALAFVLAGRTQANVLPMVGPLGQRKPKELDGVRLPYAN